MTSVFGTGDLVSTTSRNIFFKKKVVWSNGMTSVSGTEDLVSITSTTIVININKIFYLFSLFL